MATRTGTTRTTSSALSPSADRFAGRFDGHADFSFRELVHAYFDCRRHKLNTYSALLFEQEREPNLIDLFDELNAGVWRPGTSICFCATRPKVREVWAASFRDRIVHHLVYNRIHARFENAFIADSCACIKSRGPLFAARRLEAKIRSVTENWAKPAYYLKCDIANFFVSIKKPRVLELLLAKIPEPFWRRLTEIMLMHDPRTDFEFRGDQRLMALVPPHKRLMEQPSDFGLPIGNLPSQFGANVLLDVLDQHVKHQLRVRHYVRYVDDFIFLNESPERLNEILADVTAFLPAQLGVKLNSSKTILQPIDRGVDFVGQVIKPWSRSTRRRTVNEAIRRIATVDEADFLSVSNSYLGLLGQASSSHHDRGRVANVIRDRGHAVNHALTKTYRGSIL